MVNRTLSSRCQIGLEFFEFLKETNRESVSDRLELRDIYNTQFRSRWVGFILCRKLIFYRYCYFLFLAFYYYYYYYYYYY